MASFGVQRKAELANRSLMEKKLDRSKKRKKLIAIILILAILGGGIFFGKQYILERIPVAKEKIEGIAIKGKSEVIEIFDKITFFNKENEKEKFAEQALVAKETIPEEEVVDDTTLYISGTTVLEPFYSEALKDFLNLSKKEIKEHSKAVSNHESYVDLVNGDDQVIFATFPTYQETNMAELTGVDLQAIPILNGGFVFFVNKDNPIDNLTMAQLHSIYSGSITNWKDLGGKNEDIVPFQRPDNSGGQTGMYKYVITENEIMKSSDDMKMSGTEDIANAVRQSAGGMGYSYYYYLDQLDNSGNIKMISVDGVKPNKNTIAMAEYPLTTYTYAIIASEEGTTSLESAVEETTSEGAVKESLALKMQFVEWILSDEGQALAEKHGFIRHGNRSVKE